ncbi:uncharacterized protein QC763_708090 [Podospora pseudopauciseta]|uniref:Autophagy-related protein 101 n=2 Tax=Podospora TaxID=5144 RepID=A0ABR0H1E0_9PEZI|nr:hypothetical protein QC763_708090 [Podospora pseudopauciseta]KAK4668536.1 hypothetical protein QC764_708090 [Podospora pseudoanserina]
MNAEGPPEFLLEAFADPNTVRDVVRGILHTIFFMRFFQSIQAATATRDCLGIDLAYVPDSAIETLIDQRATSLARQLDAERPSGGGGRGQITVQFFEKKRRKGTWFGAGDELCWERWTIKITVAEPKTESDRAKVRKATETTLRSTVFKIMTCVTGHMDHIPPITESNVNPFPYRIYIGNPPSNQQSPSSQQKAATAAAGVGARVDAVAGGWAKKMGIY